jgi:hypothetical protein
MIIYFSIVSEYQNARLKSIFSASRNADPFFLKTVNQIVELLSKRSHYGFRDFLDDQTNNSQEQTYQNESGSCLQANSALALSRSEGNLPHEEVLTRQLKILL